MGARVGSSHFSDPFFRCRTSESQMQTSKPMALSSGDGFGPRLLGSSSNSLGMGARVKNTFVDVPLCTPESLKSSMQPNSIWTCPANVSKSLAFEDTPKPKSEVAEPFVEKPTCEKPTGAKVLFQDTPRLEAIGLTPTVGTALIPPTPSPSHVWDVQQRRPIRINQLSFDSARMPGDPRCPQVDTSDWPTLFENSIGIGSLNTLFEDCQKDEKVERNQEESDDGSSDDEGGAASTWRRAPVHRFRAPCHRRVQAMLLFPSGP